MLERDSVYVNVPMIVVSIAAFPRPRMNGPSTSITYWLVFTGATTSTTTAPALVECIIDRDDCSKNLLEWGTHVAKNNSRPPRRV